MNAQPQDSADEQRENAPKRPVYLDYQATTPTDPRVLEVMLPLFYARFGNPHSRSHAYGWQAEEAVEKARGQIAELIGADPREIVFTSGATESNNLALKGVAEFNRDRKKHIVTLQTEHKCVLDACRHLEQVGFEVTYLPVHSNGLVDVDRFRDALRDDTVMASVMIANNEIGVVQPIAELGALCRERKVLLHCDAAQAVGKIPVDVEAMKIDLLSISGHKIYAPMGIGALYVRRRNPRVRLRAQIDGGGQERGMRSGTLPLPLCVGLGEATAIASREMVEESAKLQGLSDRMLGRLRAALPEIYLNGSAEHRLPGKPECQFRPCRGRGVDDGNQGPGGFVRIGLYVGLVGAVLRVACARCHRRAGAHIATLGLWSVHHRGRSGFRDRKHHRIRLPSP